MKIANKISMKLYEYEAKKILAEFGVKIPAGIVYGLEQASRIEKPLLFGAPYVIKAQILSGARGKAGGIRFAETSEEPRAIIKEMLGIKLITPQNPEGEIVNKVLVEEKIEKEKEFYASFIIDRNIGKPILIVSPSGGVDIEEIASKNPEKLFKAAIDPLIGIQDFQIRSAADFLGLLISEFPVFLRILFKIFQEKDLLLLEINPLVLTLNKELVCLDAKIIVDDYALFRHPDFFEIKELREENTGEKDLRKAGLNYNIISDQEGIGMFSNGAGLGLDTLDRVREAGANLASFLDLGGAITTEQIELALKFMNKESQIKIIFGNIYTALLGAGKISDALLKVLNGNIPQKPIILRLEGRQAQESIEMFKNKNIANLYIFRTTEEALDCLKSMNDARNSF